MTHLNTVTAFAHACRHKTSSEIYNLFEHGISEELRGRIYLHAEQTSPEPARSAFNTIGTLMNVPSLKYY